MAFVMSWSKFVHVKKNILVLISFFCAFQLVGQVRFEQGEYVQFRTSKPGIHLLSGDEIIEWSAHFAWAMDVRPIKESSSALSVDGLVGWQIDDRSSYCDACIDRCRRQ